MKAKLTREDGKKWLKVELHVDGSVVEYASTSPAFARARQTQAPPSIVGDDPERYVRARVLALMGEGWEVREESDDLSKGRWSLDMRYVNRQRQMVAWEILTGQTGMPEGEISRTYAGDILVSADPQNLRLFVTVNEADIAENIATRIATAVRCAAPGAECHDFTAEPVKEFLSVLRQHRRYEALGESTLDRLAGLRIHLIKQGLQPTPVSSVFVGF